MERVNSQVFIDKINQLYKEIFYGYNTNDLTSMEKRKIIFDYLTNTLEYDFELLEGIKLNNMRNGNKFPRSLSNEIMNVLTIKKGVCNAISQVYKLLLEKVNIYAICICCNDSTTVPHQLNLVYDKENNTYSFDDITSVIVGRGTKEDFFNYDLEDANRLGQGNKEVNSGQKWIALPTEMVYFIVGRDDHFYRQLGITEKMEGVGINIPTNIRKSNISINDINKSAKR